MIKVYAGVAVIAVAALLGGTAWYVMQRQSADPFADCRQSAIAGGPGAIGGPFTLVDRTGQTVTEKDVITKPSLVYFGYTFCPDVCPLDNARNAEAVDILEEMGHEVTPVFISIDPERDTPEVMGDYADLLHPRMIGLTGSPDQVQAASRAYRTYYKAQDKSDDYYLVDHSTFTYLVDPQKGFLEFFKRDLTPEDLAAQVSCFLDKG
ncbi:protein SCO1/2 [Gemmobacter megaterium]|uniref:Protein SCO1/2 n=1 Tax=Gemmobacter megaterium TaxID=1086013 RepID=A0A1N7MI11_9RHOB|nr:SCO family protein [Gemmobacter megaterium]GGE06671.1 protein senC [Gemmobacter megaterium]SIS85723.1 protein SCO1/2 [Gemmobacter megaterium]